MSSAVPEGWELSPLSSLADYKNGRAFKPSDWSKSGLPILRIAQINNPHKVEDYYDGNDIDDGHFITKGDLIFSWSATLKAEIWSHYDAVLNQHIFKVTEKVGTNRSYLQQLLDYAIPKLAESSHGSTMKHIKKGVLDEFFSPVPPLPEQKKIASILTSVDEVIENTQKQIDKLQDLKKATMNELLTKGIGHTEFKDSELGRIPKSWEVSTLGDMVLKITDGEHLSPDIVTHGKPILSAKDIREDGVHISDAKFVEPTPFQKMLSRCNPEFGDVLVVSRGATIGRVTLNNLNIQFALMGSVILIKPAQEKLIGSFISLCLESETTQSEMLGLSGSSAQQAIYLKDIKSLKLPVPRLIEQNRIASLVKSIDDQKNILKSKLAQTQSLKKSLMQDLLTGKVRVTVN